MNRQHRVTSLAAPGYTLIELILVVAIVAILGAIAVPGLLRGQISANESSAVGSIRAVHSAETAYHSAAGGYADQLSTLATACPGGGHAFLSSELGSDPSVKAGYRLSLQAASGAEASRPDCNGVETRTGFYITAVPVAFPRSGRRAYATNATGSIYFDSNGNAPTEAAMAPNGGGQVLR